MLGKGISMKRAFLMLVALPLVACGAANEETSAGPETGVATDTAQAAVPVYEVTLEPGHVVRWFELGPGQTIAVEAAEFGQTPVLPSTATIAEQFAAVRPGEALPAALQALEANYERYKDATPDELAALLREAGMPTSTTPVEAVLEGRPDTGATDNAGFTGPRLSPLVMGAQDTGGDDSAFTKEEFISWSGCDNDGGLDEVRRLKRTGSDDSAISYALRVNEYIASYRGTVDYTIKARIDYDWYYGGWSYVYQNEQITRGNGKSYWVSAPGTTHVDVTAHVRYADNDGWHACLQEWF